MGKSKEAEIPGKRGIGFEKTSYRSSECEVNVNILGNSNSSERKQSRKNEDLVGNSRLSFSLDNFHLIRIRLGAHCRSLLFMRRISFLLEN